MKFKTLILALLLNINSFASEQLFIKANEAYSNSDYTTAATLYDSIISSGFESYELYFNLGNCYYQNKDWANAIWYYEKSLQLDKNEKTLENIQLAKLKIIDRIEELPQLFYKRWWNKFISIFNTAVWQYLAIVCIWLIFIIKDYLANLQVSKKGILQAFYILLQLFYCSQLMSHIKKITVKLKQLFFPHQWL